MAGMQVPGCGKKRPHEDVSSTSVQDSLPYKIRAAVQDLRPSFIEVLKTPDFPNCKAAADIREGMKRLIDLYSNGDIKAAEDQGKVNPVMEHRSNVRPPKDVRPPKLSANHAQVARFTTMGGSPFAWNFITYTGPDAVYYGRTKEAYRLANPKSE